MGSEYTSYVFGWSWGGRVLEDQCWDSPQPKLDEVDPRLFVPQVLRKSQ